MSCSRASLTAADLCPPIFVRHSPAAPKRVGVGGSLIPFAPFNVSRIAASIFKSTPFLLAPDPKSGTSLPIRLRHRRSFLENV